MKDQSAIPLFPLSTVLFPGGPLKLRIFEARYIDMIGSCMREAAPFGVVLILEGSEAGAVASTATVGTLATTHGFGPALLVSSVAFVLAAVVWIWIPETKGRALA